jgi:hypothetical protein
VTPALTMEQGSPESTSLSSTNDITVDEPTEPDTAKSKPSGSDMPEVRIEAA